MSKTLLYRGAVYKEIPLSNKAVDPGKRINGHGYRVADVNDVLMQLGRGNAKKLSWPEIEEALGTLGWIVEKTNSTVKGHFSVGFDNQVVVRTYELPPMLDNLRTQQDFEGFILENSSGAKVSREQKKQDAFIWVQLFPYHPWQPDPNYLYVKAKAPKNVAPGELYVTEARLLTRASKGADGAPVWTSETHLAVNYVLGAIGFTIITPTGKSRFFPEPVNPLDVTEFLYKNKIAKSVKEWFRGPGAAHAPQPGRVRTMENTGTCPICHRNIKMKNGRMVDHGYSVSYLHGGRHGPCPGVYCLPLEVSPECIEKHLRDLQKMMIEVKQTLAKMNDGLPVDVIVRNRRETITPGTPKWSEHGRTLNKYLDMLQRDYNERSEELAKWEPKSLSTSSKGNQNV